MTFFRDTARKITHAKPTHSLYCICSKNTSVNTCGRIILPDMIAEWGKKSGQEGKHLQKHRGNPRIGDCKFPILTKVGIAAEQCLHRSGFAAAITGDEVVDLLFPPQML